MVREHRQFIETRVVEQRKAVVRGKALAREPGVVMARDQLMDRVWGYRDYAGGRVVDSHVARIRRKLGEDGNDPRFIRTVHGVGYAFKE